MSNNEPAAIFARILELPPVSMVRSGHGDLDAFNQWWKVFHLK